MTYYIGDPPLTQAILCRECDQNIINTVGCYHTDYFGTNSQYVIGNDNTPDNCHVTLSVYTTDTSLANTSQTVSVNWGPNGCWCVSSKAFQIHFILPCSAQPLPNISGMVIPDIHYQIGSGSLAWSTIQNESLCGPYDTTLVPANNMFSVDNDGTCIHINMNITDITKVGAYP